MATGYTSKIKDGISFKEFLLNCAKAFGACITMRDDPMDAPIPDEFQISDYHIKRLAEIQSEFESINLITIDEAVIKAKEEYEQKKKYNEQQIKESNELRLKYNDILIKVKNWRPPTSDHFELKNFMIQQITSSIDFDCGTTYYEKPIELLTGEQWLSNKKQSLLNDIEYHTKEHQKEIDRVMQRNQWIKQLRDSIKE